MVCRCLFALLLCLAGLTQAGTMDERLAGLERDLEVLRVALDVPALALVLVDRDQVLLSKTYGVIDRDSREPFGPEHFFRIGSITKTFTALAVLRPVGMHSATLRPEPRVMDHLVTGYDGDGETVIPYWHMSFHAFGGVNLKLGKWSGACNCS